MVEDIRLTFRLCWKKAILQLNLLLVSFLPVVRPLLLSFDLLLLAHNPAWDAMRCHKSRFQIWIIVFDEFELILCVSQGLTPSTASLVSFWFIFFLSALSFAYKNIWDSQNSSILLAKIFHCYKQTASIWWSKRRFEMKKNFFPSSSFM